MAEVNNTLQVNRKHLREALKYANRVGGISKQPAVLTFHDGQFKIELGGCSFCADAEGTWLGQVEVPLSLLRKLLGSLPRGKEAVLIATNGKRLRVEELVVPCHWDALVYPRIQMHLGAGLRDYLMLPFKYSDEDIERSGLITELQEATERRDNLIGKAASMLGPLGIEEKHLHALLTDLLAQQVANERGDS